VADVFAAQLKHAVNEKVLNERAFPIQNNKTVGKYLVDNLFKYGDLLPWEMLVVRATGESLNSSYFIKELVVDNEDEM
jgi:Zn-dependent M32 family carboxypeptidase